MLPIKIDDPPESLVDKTAISNEISWKKGWKSGFVPDINTILIIIMYTMYICCNSYDHWTRNLKNPQVQYFSFFAPDLNLSLKAV